MIPKIIHYIWLSNDRKPVHIRKCMATWQKRLPDYEIKCWSTDNFDIDSVPYIKEAVKVRKWAFAADYIRLYALYTEGGFYFDSDVVVKKTFDDFLDKGFVTGIEFHPDEFRQSAGFLDADGNPFTKDSCIPGLGIQAAVMGSEKEHPFVKACLDSYKDKHFILPDGSLNDKIIAPCIYAKCAEQFGFVYKNKRQTLPGTMTVFESDIFAGGFSERSENSYAIHFAEGSWRNKSMKEHIRQSLVNNSFIRKICGKEPLY